MAIDIGAGVELNKADVGLANVDNTADADKPISTAAQEAIEQNKVFALAGMVL